MTPRGGWVCFHSAIWPSHSPRAGQGAPPAAVPVISFNICRLMRQSPTRGTLTGMFLRIEVGSMSMCTMAAWRANASVFPVTRSSKRTPTPSMRSQVDALMLAA
jgi:hypothetical protein